MASIQCAIELYDGVSPVLRDMGAALAGFHGQLVQFGEEMGAVSPDVEGVLGLQDALGGLVEEGQRAHGVLGDVLAVSKGLSRVFSEEMFSPLMEGAAGASREISGIALAAEESTAALMPMFASAGEEIGSVFGEMAGDVSRTFDHLGGHIAGFAGGLPGYFAGPLAQISGMFASMAASARASMNAVAGSAAAATRAVAAASSAVSQASVRPASFSGGGGVTPLGLADGRGLAPPAAQVSLLGLTEGLALELPAAQATLLGVVDGRALAPPETQVNLLGLAEGLGLAPPAVQVNLAGTGDSRILELPEPEVYLQGEKREAALPAVVTVTVQNENHIASEVDAEMVLRNLEIRLAEAVASSVEGVYG